MKQKTHITFSLNGEQAEVAFAPHKTLLEVLREAIPAQAGVDIQLCVEVLDIDREPYAKLRLPG